MQWYWSHFRPPRLLFTRIYIALVWFSALLYRVLESFWSTQIFYSPWALSCTCYVNSSYIFNLASYVRNFAPLGGIILANLVILGIVLSLKPIGSEAMNRRKPAMLVFGICFVFLMACMPSCIYFFTNCDAYLDWYDRWGNALSIGTLYVHLVFNPFIYTLTNKRFRNIVLKFI